MHFDLYIYFSFSFTLIGFSFAFTNGTYAGIDAESGMKNTSQAEPRIWIAFQFSTLHFIYMILIFPSFFS